ncbi:hypothetical protein [Euzebya sp.]
MCVGRPGSPQVGIEVAVRMGEMLQRDPVETDTDVEDDRALTT